MERSYDLFEIMPDGCPLWRAAVSGHENALIRLKEWAAKTPNEVRIMHLPTSTIIAVLNTTPA